MPPLRAHPSPALPRPRSTAYPPPLAHACTPASASPREPHPCTSRATLSHAHFSPSAAPATARLALRPPQPRAAPPEGAAAWPALGKHPPHLRRWLPQASSAAAGQGVAGSEEDPAAEAAVEVEGVGLSLGKAHVLRGCSLRIPKGQLWMLLGPNGCGKSTLLKVLAGLMVPDSGRVRVQQPRSFVFQNPDHQVVMPTVESDVAFGLGSLRRPMEEGAARERVKASLDAVGMLDYAGRSVQTLSGGQKQRVAIAGALALQARVLLLDELTTFLDYNDQMGVVRAVRQVVGGPRGVSALWVTHRLEELQYADGAVYMEAGSVSIAGDPKLVEGHILKLRMAQRQQGRRSA